MILLLLLDIKWCQLVVYLCIPSFVFPHLNLSIIHYEDTGSILCTCAYCPDNLLIDGFGAAHCWQWIYKTWGQHWNKYFNCLKCIMICLSCLVINVDNGFEQVFYIPCLFPDISATSFYKPVIVVEFVAEYLNIYDIMRPLSDPDRIKVNIRETFSHLNYYVWILIIA